MKSNKGITLVALVVTIIILIILAGVSINMVVGENGLITKAKRVKEEQEIAQITEKLEMYKMSSILDSNASVNTEGYLTYVDKLNREGKLSYKIDNVVKIDEGCTYITVDDNYQYELQENNGALRIIYKGKMDQVIPETTVVLSNKSVSTEASITAQVTQSDQSVGVNTTSCKWVLNSIPTPIGTDEVSYTGGTFESNEQTIVLTSSVPGKYFLHVLTVNNAQNKKETIVELEFLAAEYQDYSTQALPHTHTASGGACYKVTATCGARASWQDWTDSNGNKTGGEWYCPRGHGIIQIGWGSGNAPSCGRATSYALNCSITELGTITLQESTNTGEYRLKVLVDNASECISNITYTWSSSNGTYTEVSSEEIILKKAGTYTCVVNYKDSKTNATGSKTFTYTATNDVP